MTPTPCQCCGLQPATQVYGEPDESGHVWTYSVCEHCREHCSSDLDGRPVHMRPDWDGSPETFEMCRATK